MPSINTRFAASAVLTIKTDGRNIHFAKIRTSADAQGTLTFTDGNKTIVLDVAPGGANHAKDMVFDGSADVTITCAGANITLQCENYFR